MNNNYNIINYIIFSTSIYFIQSLIFFYYKLSTNIKYIVVSVNVTHVKLFSVY